MTGNDVSLSTYSGKILLIVNVASKWYLLNKSRLDFIIIVFYDSFFFFFYAKSLSSGIVSL